MVDNLILLWKAKTPYPCCPYLYRHSCWSRVHDGFQCRASLPSPLVGCLTSIYINCLRVVRLESRWMAFTALFATWQWMRLYLYCPRSGIRANTRIKDKPGSRFMRLTQQTTGEEPGTVNNLKQVYQYRSPPSVLFRLSDAIFTRYTPHSISQFATIHRLILWTKSAECVLRGVKLLIGYSRQVMVDTRLMISLLYSGILDPLVKHRNLGLPCSWYVPSIRDASTPNPLNINNWLSSLLYSTWCRHLTQIPLWQTMRCAPRRCSEDCIAQVARDTTSYRLHIYLFASRAQLANLIS